MLIANVSIRIDAVIIMQPMRSVAIYAHSNYGHDSHMNVCESIGAFTWVLAKSNWSQHTLTTLCPLYFEGEICRNQHNPWWPVGLFRSIFEYSSVDH